MFLRAVDVKCFHQLNWGGGGAAPPPTPPWGYFGIPFFDLSFVVSTDTLLSMLVLREQKQTTTTTLCPSMHCIWKYVLNTFCS